MPAQSMPSPAPSAVARRKADATSPLASASASRVCVLVFLLRWLADVVALCWCTAVFMFSRLFCFSPSCSGFGGPTCSVDCATSPADPACIPPCPVGQWGMNCSGTCPGGVAQPCLGRGPCSAADGVCACDDPWIGDSCQLPCPVNASRAVCSAHGACRVSSGGASYCDCENGYFGSLCEGLCPGQGCNGHGVCDNDGQCVCSAGYWGVACEQTCPGGPTNPCSNGGVCDGKTGMCGCVQGRFGADCSGTCTRAIQCVCFVHVCFHMFTSSFYMMFCGRARYLSGRAGLPLFRQRHV